MIKKCEHAGCQKSGTCRCPKTRDLREYWYFCPEHAAEYNKNWNYYAGMSADEIEEDWERQTFGSPLKDKTQANADEADYIKFLNDFINGRSAFDKMPAKTTLPGPVMSALKLFDLPISATMRDVGVRYRALAKKHHPDRSGSATEFAKISAAYDTLKKHFGKK